MSRAPRIDALLRAGRMEQPPPGNEQRLVSALGLGTGAAGGIAVGSAAVRAWLRWMGLGLLVTAVAATSALARRGRLGPTLAVDTPPAPPSRLELEDRLVVAPVALTGGSLAEREAPVPARLRLRAPRFPANHAASSLVAPGHVPSTSAATPSSEASPLDAELARLRDAKLALRRRDAGAALSALEDHARSFPQSAFAEEAAALHIEALIAAGRLEDARRAAAAFHAAYPRSPYATFQSQASFPPPGGRP